MVLKPFLNTLKGVGRCRGCFGNPLMEKRCRGQAGKRWMKRGGGVDARRQAGPVGFLDARESGQAPAQPRGRLEAGGGAAATLGARPLQRAHREQRQGSPRRALLAVRHSGKEQHSRRAQAGSDPGPDRAPARIPHDLPADLHGWAAAPQESAADMDGLFRRQVGQRHAWSSTPSDKTARPGSTCADCRDRSAARDRAFSRPTIGHIDIDVTIDDPKAYTKPWTVKLAWRLMPDTDLIESICEENNKDPVHMVGSDALITWSAAPDERPHRHRPGPRRRRRGVSGRRRCGGNTRTSGDFACSV